MDSPKDDPSIGVLIAIEYVEVTHQKVILQQLDLNKAYDRISQSYIMQVLGFGPRMAHVMLGLGEDGSSNNNMIVGGFSVHKSIKKECPLIPLLFVIASHPLIYLLKNEASKGYIQGLILSSNKQLLIKMFVDDSLLFLQGDVDCLRNALHCVQRAFATPFYNLNIIQMVGYCSTFSWKHQSY